LRAAFAWNLAVEIARLGGDATLLAPAETGGSALWPAPGRGPIGARLSFTGATNLPELNRAALDLAVSRAADAADGGVILTRVPPSWMHQTMGNQTLLRWVLLFASPDSNNLQEAYALTKRLAQLGSKTRIGVTIHGAQKVSEAERAFRKLAGTALNHLHHSVVSYGLLVDDLHVYRAIVAQRPIGLEHPQSRAARALRDVARMLLDDARNHSVG
jgi:MinD-like ATPase involved in chromosome partitioning or flagellar assembly